MRRRQIAVGVALLLLGARATTASAPPSVVFILLDTTRADRMSGWGASRATTPALDALARDGVRFARHYANSHATRPSMPQLMTGRYYHQNILATFETDAHPREMSFTRGDSTAILLPALFRRAGYRSAAVSAHTWVAPDSAFGQPFDHFELLPFTAEQAHGDAKPLVDRAIALWQARDRSRPLFLYLHFMDLHMPRRLPAGDLWFPLPDYDWKARFNADGEPDFDGKRRRWDRSDARDFGPLDRAYFTTVYDNRLRYADGQIARLLAAVRADDPDLAHTLIVVTADHGEELGEDGRVDHTASLADGVQHVPWILAGGPVGKQQVCDGLTEHVDVVPTLAALLGVPLPAGVVVDGRARLGSDGALLLPCGGRTAHYAWEDYRAVRAGHYLLSERPPGTPAARCLGDASFYRMDDLHRIAVPMGGPAQRRVDALHEDVRRTLLSREERYRRDRYGSAERAFLVRTDSWVLADDAMVRCLPVDEDTTRDAILAGGWFWSGRGIALLPSGLAPDLSVTLNVPPGDYRAEAATTPIQAPPRWIGFGRWRRRSFLDKTPSAFVPLGTLQASAGALRVRLPAGSLRGHHLLGIRLTPPGATGMPPPSLDPEQRKRLKALGYVD